MGTRRPLTPHAERHLALLLQAFPDLVVTSTWRTWAENRRVGGARRSYHLRGRAVDVVHPRGDYGPVIDFAWRQRVTPRCSGPEEVIFEGDHLHLAW